MTASDLDQLVKLKRQEIVTDFFDKNDIECIWQSSLRMSLNGLNFTWYSDFSGVEFDLHRTLTDSGWKTEDFGTKELNKVSNVLEKLFHGKNLNDFDNLVKIIKSSNTIYASRKVYTTNRKLGVFEKIKSFKNFK